MMSTSFIAISIPVLPHVFCGAAPDAESILKNLVTDQVHRALKVQLHPLQLILCGSAHLGFSPVPEKLGKPFDPVKSDIDIAVVSQELFDVLVTVHTP